MSDNPTGSELSGSELSGSELSGPSGSELSGPSGSELSGPSGSELSGPSGPSSPIFDRFRAGVACLGKSSTESSSVTSDLSIDEVLLLHSQGWEPAGLVFGASFYSLPQGTWWGASYDPTPTVINLASEAANNAFSQAAKQLHRDCTKANGQGVVGIEINVEQSTHHVKVELIGTAIRQASTRSNDKTGSSRSSRSSRDPFLSDLSARDFVLLERAGWEPTGIVFGFSFVSAPRRKVTALKQMTQNVELTTYTTALYAAREQAFSQLQRAAAIQHANGVVGVSVDEGPLSFARHVVAFDCWGTAVRLVAESHKKLNPATVIELDDQEIDFDASSLRS